LDEKGNKTFPNAKLYLSTKEHDYFVDKSGKDVIRAYSDKLVKFDPQKGLIENCVKPIYAIGHTPGHTVFQIDNMLVWGDLTHVMDIQMTYPNVAITYDTDSKQAVESRLKILKYVVENKLNVAGMHIAYPGMGTLKSNGKGGYVFMPLR
jgi:glyoxylase-like metal-dependent hydrolase (beta-lactamase superfamily II)